MFLKLYSIYDRVAGTYSEPFCMLKDELAVRRFNYIMQNSPMVAKDCDLFAVASFVVDNGVVCGLERPEFICRYEVKSGE